jgi:hypothetical protein
MIDGRAYFRPARASAYGSVGNSSLERLNSNRACCRLGFSVTPCKQKMARVSNRQMFFHPNQSARCRHYLHRNERRSGST